MKLKTTYTHSALKIISGGTAGVMTLGMSDAAVTHFDFTDFTATDLGTSTFDTIQNIAINITDVTGTNPIVNATQVTPGAGQVPPVIAGTQFYLTPRNGLALFKSTTYTPSKLTSQSGLILTGTLSAGDLISSANTGSGGGNLASPGTADRYIGFHAVNRYGWIRFSGNGSDTTLTAHDAAIESTTGHFIEAGSLTSYMVPEPSTSLLLAISTGALITRRRRNTNSV